uniref:Uncharacterized protein n=1 Tax=Panagrolaimus davidi TaxID=227884 RepID=A0A914QJG5_9BILA
MDGEIFVKKVVGEKSIESCYNITSIIPKNCAEKEYIALISACQSYLKIGIYGFQSKEAYVHVVVSDIQGFIDGIAKIFDSKIKAVILEVYGFSSEKFPNNIQFCKALKAKFGSIPYSFISDYNFLLTKILVAVNISVKLGEFILVLLIAENYFEIVVLEYTKNGHEVLRHQRMNDMEVDADELRERILGETVFQKILFCSWKGDNQVENTLKNVLKAETKKFVMINLINGSKFIGDGLIEESKWILNKKYTKFHVLPTCARIYVIGFERGDEKLTPLYEKFSVALPYENSVIVPKSCFNYFLRRWGREMSALYHSAAHDAYICFFRLDILME